MRRPYRPFPVQQGNLNRLIGNYGNYPNISYSVQNCNSLNISTVCNKQLTKIIAIIALCTDIIFLSDLRLNSNDEQVEKIRKLFLYSSHNQYDSFFHLTKNNRGVGILISRKIYYTVSKTYKDEAENILGMKIEIDGFPLRIFSIYGPNHDNKDFYDRIDTFLSQDSQVPAVLGGDWNSTYSTAPVNDNIDIRNMRSPPSINRSTWLREICSKHHCSDPFRALHPNLRDFTYAPNGARANRSRLDFFLIYDELIPQVRSCSIMKTQQVKVLDHKPVILTFIRDKIKSKPTISKTVLSMPRTDDIVLASVLDAYLIHVDADDAENIAAATPPGVHYAAGINPIQVEKN
jgi:exonuclease III